MKTFENKVVLVTGASANSKMAHIAITNFKGDENVVWLNPVTSEQYEAVYKK
jgi:hypothetical protein